MIDAEQHVIYKLMNAEIREFPFSHFYVSEIFPEDYYRDLLRNLPAKDAYTPLNSTGKVPFGAYPERGVFPLESEFIEKLAPDSGDFWKKLSEWMGGKRFFDWVSAKFEYLLEGRNLQHLERKMELVRDLYNYQISPHTDIEKKVLTLIFYLPSNAEHPHWGTSIYMPNHPYFKANNNFHLSRNSFTEAYRMPFLPNSLFGFIRSDTSFHGVEPIQEINAERTTLTYLVQFLG